MITPFLLAAAIQSDPSFVKQLVPIKIESDSYRDLEPIRRAIGNARVVQLGELTHGDGTSFRIKSRLVKFLHEKAGFDVLVWESGLVDTSALDERLAGGGSIADIAATAVFPHWSRAKESIGVFEYAAQSQKTSRPLVMAGFDIQSSGSSGNSVFLDLAAEILEFLPHSKLRPQIDEFRKMQAGVAREEAILTLAKPLQTEFNQLNIEPSDRKVQFLIQKLKSFVAYFEMMEAHRKFLSEQTGVLFQVGYNLRERANFENLKWLINSQFRGKKLIVWAHNAHISHLGAEGNYYEPEAGQVVLDSTGRHLKAMLKNQLYSIGIVASGGSWSWLGQPPIEFSVAPTGSFEDLLSRAGIDTGFLNLRNAKALSKPYSGMINRQGEQRNDMTWPRVFDGVVYIKNMKPRT